MPVLRQPAGRHPEKPSTSVVSVKMMTPVLVFSSAVAKVATGSEQIVLNAVGMFYAPPEKMIVLAESWGLSLKTYFRHRDR
jgi:hypothetical protein